MTEQIIKHFVKNRNDVKNPAVRETYGKLAGWAGVLSNSFLFLIKILTGIFFHSISIIADAVNNLSDAASSIITLIGFKLSGKPADAEHPYGHARMEYITGLIVSFVILFLGLQLISSSVNKIFHPEEVHFSYITFFVLAVSILLKLWQGMFNQKIGKRIHSSALQATAADSLNDVYATTAVLFSAVIAQFTGFQLDGYMGVAVALFIMISGIKFVIETVNPLLGTAPDKDLVNIFYQKILSYDGVIGLHDLVIHNYGPERCFASVHVEVPAKQDIMVSHDVIDNIEYDFLHDLNIHLVIHLDPIVTDDERVNHLKEQVTSIVKTVSEELSIHDFRVVFGNTHSNLLFDIMVPFSFSMSDKELCHVIDQKVKQLNETYHTVITIDRSYISTTTRNQ